MLADFRDWCKSRSALPRLLVWAYLAYVGYQQYIDPSEYNSLFGAINLCIHEGGHILFRAFGDLPHVLGGTITQLAAPIVSMSILWQQRDYFGISVCLGWLSTNLVYVGNYMADARAMEMPLVSVEGGVTDYEVSHDWHNLFSRWNLLDQDTAIGLATRGIGAAVMVLALISGALIIFGILRYSRSR